MPILGTLLLILNILYVHIPSDNILIAMAYCNGVFSVPVFITFRPFILYVELFNAMN